MMESIFFNPWIWIIPILLVLLIGVAVLDAVYDWMGMGAVISGLLFLTLGGIYFGAILPPYDASFYQTYRVTGTITEYDAALADNGDGVFSRGFVIEVAGVDYQIWSDDQRFRTVSEGDDVNLVCGKVFNYFQEPYLDCAFGGRP